LKDIPIIGFLFSGEDTEERAVETIFILTPTISTKGKTKKVVMKEIQRKHEPDTPSGLGEMITDPFGFKARDEARMQSVHDAEQSRLEAEVEKAQARIDIREAEERAQKAENERLQMEVGSEKIKADAEEAKATADKAIAEAKKAMEEANKAKAEAEAKLKAAEEAKIEDPDEPETGAEKSAPQTEQPAA